MQSPVVESKSVVAPKPSRTGAIVASVLLGTASILNTGCSPKTDSSQTHGQRPVVDDRAVIVKITQGFEFPETVSFRFHVLGLGQETHGYVVKGSPSDPYVQIIREAFQQPKDAKGELITPVTVRVVSDANPIAQWNEVDSEGRRRVRTDYPVYSLELLKESAEPGSNSKL